METPYKLSVDIGAYRFSAEGPEQTVKQDFQNFLETIKSLGSTMATQGASPDVGSATPDTSAPDSAQPLDRALLDRVFQVDGKGIVSLRLLPDTPNKAADAALFLLYGYRVLSGLQDVPVMKLNDGLRQSGISVERLDRFIGTHSAYYMKGGTRSGGRYTLNNQGMAMAETMLKRVFQ